MALRGGDAVAPYSYRDASDGRVVLAWHGRDVAVLEGLRAQRFLDRVRSATDDETQRLIAGMVRRF